MKQGLISIISATILFTTSCKEHKEEKKEEIQFIVTSPIEIDTTFNKEYVCQLQSVQHIEIRALEKGYLQNIYVNEGQYVKKGQIMFQIMPLIYQAETQKSEAEVNFAKIEYQNTKQLADSNIVSKNELALAKAKLDKAKAELLLAKAHLSFTEIRAPFNGIIDRFNVRLGSLLNEGELLTTLADNSKMWGYFNVPEAEYLDYISLEKSANNAIVMLEMANHKVFDQKGEVETIEADFNNETGNIAFRATFPNPKRILRHGETGKILMPIILKNAVIIPQRATFDVLDKKFVYIVDASNTLKAKQITVSQEMPHLYVVASGLNAKDKILAEGLGKVKNNERIKYSFMPFAKELAELNNLHAE
ncbi:MAG: efflux RND transporter periplasmic adaptor subunit [Sediminibacterium sp.]|nr:MAG: efflux RND transporter periplasmic adaptor subunit [Sediminibacterium sp.] [Sediminibacterium sp. FEMGT703S]